ncbi:endonuclease/exonuclease/phosphatase family protein [Spirillospora sp. NPDC047279]|uniref:endonuclease/exonuclease/phosphatase family protein n=1 Tax=Spirillospora sp. NPDC047279 TaxID=3155478 RepID=UPI0033E70599
MRLLTFNTYFRRPARPRHRVLAERVERDGYDIVCLQEFMFRGNLGLIRDRLPHHAVRGAVLVEGGLVVLSRWPIAGSRLTRFPMAGGLRGEFLMRKGAQVARIRTPEGDLAVVNTHLTYNRNDEWGPGSRFGPVLDGELRTLGRVIGEIPEHVPVVVMGDFNIARESPLLREFAARTGLRDLLAGDARPTVWPEEGYPARPIDHVFTRGAATGTADLVFTREVRLAGGRAARLSDHYGIATDLHLG